MIYGKELTLQSKGELDVIDLSPQVQEVVNHSGITNGLVCVFVPGATGAITTIEYEPGLLHDLPSALERLFPKGIPYEHELQWHDGNGHSHVRASVLGPSLTIPIRDGRAILGTWQQIVFIELDIRARSRRILVQVMGE